jgi:hypothetical protein
VQSAPEKTLKLNHSKTFGELLMAVDICNMSDEAYYKLLHTELNEAIAPRHWKLLVSNREPWLLIVQTPAWNYMVKARRWTHPEISPNNSVKSRVILRGILTEILTKNRA